MNLVRYHFGTYTPLGRTKGEHVTVWLENKDWLLEDPLREPPRDYTIYGGPEVQRGSFELSDFGKHDRLSWGSGACAIDQNAKLVYWADRYAAWPRESEIAIVDATRSLVATLALPLMVVGSDKPMVHAGVMWAHSDVTVVGIPLAELEALFDRPSGTIEVRAKDAYPRRRTGRIQKATVIGIDSLNARAHFPGALRAIEFPIIHLDESIAIDTEVTLYDELVPGRFLEIEWPHHPRVPLYASPVADSTRLARSPERRKEPDYFAT